MKILPLNDADFLRSAGECAGGLGLRLYAVGGCVRDWLLGRAVADVDFLCGSDPRALVSALAEKYGGQATRFARFLTTRLFLSDGRRLDFAVFRKETYARPAALPEVSQAASVEEDLVRRDFSCNAMAISLLPDDFGALSDPHRGAEDVRAGLIRTLHPGSFTDDPTRIYRAARFAGRFGWRLEAASAAQAEAAVRAGIPGLLSRERLRNELLKLLGEPDPLPSFRLLDSLGALNFLHQDFKYGPECFRPADATGRLAALAAGMGPAGGDFIKSLRLTRDMSRRLGAA